MGRQQKKSFYVKRLFMSHACPKKKTLKSFAAIGIGAEEDHLRYLSGCGICKQKITAGSCINIWKALLWPSAQSWVKSKGMTRKVAKRFCAKYSQRGELLITASQVKKRLHLCREALSNNKSYTTRFKDIYESLEEIEDNAMKEFEIAGLFTDRYFHYKCVHGAEFIQVMIRALCQRAHFSHLCARDSIRRPQWMRAASGLGALVNFQEFMLQTMLPNGCRLIQSLDTS